MRSYEVTPEVPHSYNRTLYQYIYRFFLLPQKERFADISRDDFSISYTVIDASQKRRLEVQVSGSDYLKVSIEPLVDSVSDDEFVRSKEDIDIAVNMFEDQVRKNSVFFAWREGESVVPEKVSGKENKSLQRIFLETQILLIAVFMTVGIFLFFLIGPLVPIVLLAIQFVFVFYSNKIISRAADWHITEKNPYIHILQYPLSAGIDNPSAKLSDQELAQLKQQIYKETIAENGELDCQKAHSIFSKFGINCDPQNLIARKVNVYDIVKTTADKFGYKVPETVVSNTLLPNAAASGPAPAEAWF